jgi:predicted HTH domain antitoxin
MSLMEVTVEIPEDIARQLHAKWDNLPRGVLESLALEAYRSGNLTTAQLRRLLGFQTPMEVDAFLKQAGIYLDYDLNDLEEDLQTVRRVRGE